MTAASGARDRWRGLRPVALLLPIALLYLAIYIGGLAMIGATSIGLSPDPGESRLTLAFYGEALGAPAIQAIVLRTLRVSLMTVLACLALGFPVARYIVAADSRWRGVVLMCVLSPLMVSAIGRIFGWIALFGPGSLIAQLMTTHFGSRPTGLLYTEAAMVIGLTNLLLPFMVLSVAASRAHLDPQVLKAARSLGASPFAVFRQVELPLTLPGLVGGGLIVFSLAIGNFVTAALLGGSGRDVVAYHVYLDILVYFEDRRGTALAMLLLVADVLLIAAAIRITRRATPEERTGGAVG